MSDPFVKDPGDKLDYQVDYTDWLASDTISASSWSVTPSGPTLSGQSVNAEDTVATCWVEGGTHGREYRLTNAIETAGGRKKQKSITIVVREQ